MMEQQSRLAFEELASRFPGRSVMGDEPDLHLFHAANSVCSQKVRAVLFEIERPFVSHELNLMSGDTYDPDYVSIRVEGCEAAGVALATSHGAQGEGSTSVALTGCDPCVVPTIVGAKEFAIYFDSRKISLMLAESDAGRKRGLVPEPLRAEIDEQLRVIDDLPNYQLLAAFVSGGRPTGDVSHNAFAAAKVERCDALIAEHRENPGLVTAYRAKRDKELLATNRLFDKRSMDRADQAMAGAVRELERQLGSGSRYLYGDAVTIADLFWAIELIRLADMGMEHLWKGEGGLRVADYLTALSAERSIREAVLLWPGARIKARAPA